MIMRTGLLGNACAKTSLAISAAIGVANTAVTTAIGYLIMVPSPFIVRRSIVAQAILCERKKGG
jgi:hypothetical protein